MRDTRHQYHLLTFSVTSLCKKDKRKSNLSIATLLLRLVNHKLDYHTQFVESKKKYIYLESLMKKK